jgi:hypothetical protein
VVLLIDSRRYIAAQLAKLLDAVGGQGSVWFSDFSPSFPNRAAEFLVQTLRSQRFEVSFS